MLHYNIGNHLFWWDAICAIRIISSDKKLLWTCFLCSWTLCTVCLRLNPSAACWCRILCNSNSSLQTWGNESKRDGGKLISEPTELQAILHQHAHLPAWRCSGRFCVVGPPPKPVRVYHTSMHSPFLHLHMKLIVIYLKQQKQIYPVSYFQSYCEYTG